MVLQQADENRVSGTFSALFHATREQSEEWEVKRRPCKTTRAGYHELKRDTRGRLSRTRSGKSVKVYNT